MRRLRALALALLLAAPAFAAAPPAVLLGDWVEDIEASEDLDPILAARGATWLERQAIRHLTVTYHFRADGEVLTMEVRSSMYSRVEELHVDDRTRARTSSRLGDYTIRHFYDEEGALVSVSHMTLPDGVPARLTVTRSLVDDQTLEVVWHLSAEDGRDLRARRVLRRQRG